MMLHSSANRTGLKCKTCQINPCFLQKQIRQKIHFDGSLSATKCYPYKAQPRNLSAISPTRNVVCMYAHIPVHTAVIWKTMYIFFFYLLKAFLSLNWDKYSPLYWCFCVRISFILLLIKWSEMDPNVKPQTMTDEGLSSLKFCL